MRKYLIIWGVLFLILCCASVFVNWDAMAQAISATFSGVFDTIFTGVMSIGLVIFFIRMFIS